MKLKCIFASFVAILLVTGCVSAYIAPESGPIAKFNIKNNSNFGIEVAHYEDDKKCTGARAIQPGLNPYAELTTTIKANVNQVFILQPIKFNGAVLSSCKLLPSFIPKSNGIYTAIVDIENKKCYISIIDELTQQRVKNVVMREYNPPFIESQGFCKPLGE